MAKRLLPLSLLAASTLFATPDFGFQGDTTISVGVKEIPVTQTITVDTITFPDSNVVWDTLYNDSLGRLVQWSQRTRDFEDSILIINIGNASFNMGDSIASLSSYSYKSSNDFNSTTFDTLSAIEWNSAGQITAGINYKRKKMHSTEHGEYSMTTEDVLLIDYDSTGITATDTTLKNVQGAMVPDTFYTAGALTLPVKDVYWKSSGGAPWSGARSRTMTDSVGRKLVYTYSGSSAKSNTRWGNSHSVELGENGYIATMYSNSYSNSSQGGGRSRDTLTGITWNDKGMITKGSVTASSTSSSKKGSNTTYSQYKLLIAYDSSGLNPVDSFVIKEDGFQAEILYKAGDIYIPAINRIKSGGKYENREYCDSLGRMIMKGVSSPGPGSHQHYYMDFDSTGRVKRIRHSRGHASPNSSSRGSDTLTAKTWNEQGMMLNADFRRVSSSTNPGGTTKVDTTYNVTLVYDSTGLFPVDTIYNTETPVQVTVVPGHHGFRSVVEKGYLSMTGLESNEAVRIVSANGRLLLQGEATATGALRLPLQNISSGVHFLISSERRVKFVK